MATVAPLEVVTAMPVGERVTAVFPCAMANVQTILSLVLVMDVAFNPTGVIAMESTPVANVNSHCSVLLCPTAVEMACV